MTPRFGDVPRTTALLLLAVRLADDPLAGAVADRVDQRRATWAMDTVMAGNVNQATRLATPGTALIPAGQAAVPVVAP